MLSVGDIVQMKKKHPCGSDRWTVTRVGADVKIRCSGCEHVVMMDRPDFEKRLKKILIHTEEEIHGEEE
ncbi:MAG: DUF951 domain-containing protein [Clostridia bacterium]|nr:DUF951 domain-containing protein [Clostridia bacterium]MBQ4620997.1 DUF951 domain-containing protein [Clostridia bacterium]MBQ9856375.1 DUF951 domain-containing protein [Clostridia bacterium]